jgi:hypothetical protein
MKTTNLRSQARVAREIGYLMMYAANLEIMFVSILTALLDDNPSLPVSIGTQVDNATAKMNILFDAAKDMTTDRLARVVCDAEIDIKKSIAFRNRLVHGLFVFDKPTGEFQLASNFLTHNRSNPKCERLIPETVKTQREVLRKAIARIIRAGGKRIRNPDGGSLARMTA